MDTLSGINYLREEDFFYKLLSPFGAKTLNPVSIIGLPHSGKTSFTRHICKKEIVSGYFKAADKKLAMVLVPVAEPMTVADFYKKLSDKVGEQTGIRNPTGIYTYEECYEYLAKLVAGDYLIVLIINKFEIMLRNNDFDRDFYYNLRALCTDITPVGSVVWVTTSSRSLIDLMKDKSVDNISDFYNIFSNFVYLGLNYDEVCQVFRRLEKETGYRMEDAVIRCIIGYFGRIPGIISLAMEKTLVAMQKNEPDYFGFCKKECNHLLLYNYFDQIWGALDPYERTLLYHIRQEDRSDESEIPSLGFRLLMLETHGLIDRTGDRYQLSSLAFSDWMDQYCYSTGKCRPEQHEKVKNTAIPDFAPSMENRYRYILHLSDLHISSKKDSELYLALYTDLKDNLGSTLGIDRIHYLVVSGDVSNTGSETEFAEGRSLLDKIVCDFSIPPENIVMVPGNHDLNWARATEAYAFYTLDSKDGDLIGEIPVRLNESVIGYLRSNEPGAREKFENFAAFYRDMKGQPYPLDFQQQGNLIKNEDHRILFLCLNSSWRMDQFHRDSRLSAGINQQALSNAVQQLGKARDMADWLKIAVLHHPVSGNDAVNSDFLEILAQNGFKIILHGHIHESEHNLSFYNPWNYRMHSIGAGTFGADSKNLVAGTPWQYNLIRYEPDAKNVTVFTRKKTRLTGAWTGDAVWPVPGKEQEELKQAFYEFGLL